MRKSVLVLGASSGIGKATSERFAKEGWLVVLAALGIDAMRKIVSSLEGKGHIAIELDVTSDDQIKELRKVLERNGGFHCLVNSVGISHSVSITTLRE